MQRNKLEPKTSRNATCPCGSGRKYKDCCGHPAKHPASGGSSYFTLEIPRTVQVYYLDTCVWSPLAESEAARAGAKAFFVQREKVLALSVFTAFELTRAAEPIIQSLDSLFFDLRQHIYFAAIYDQVIESELALFPRPWRMKWLPLTAIADYNTANMIETFANSPMFVASRDEHYQFGLDRFMYLEDLKKNFPPLHGPEYTIEDADHFAYGSTIDYLQRQFPEFFRKHRTYFRKRLSEGTQNLLSSHVRSLFLFLKYYLHGQSPEPSDFFDFAQISYAPYSSVFVTERNAGNVLKRMKTNNLMLENTDILHVTEFLEMMKMHV